MSCLTSDGFTYGLWLSPPTYVGSVSSPASLMVHRNGGTVRRSAPAERSSMYSPPMIFAVEFDAALSSSMTATMRVLRVDDRPDTIVVLAPRSETQCSVRSTSAKALAAALYGYLVAEPVIVPEVTRLAACFSVSDWYLLTV